MDAGSLPYERERLCQLIEAPELVFLSKLILSFVMELELAGRNLSYLDRGTKLQHRKGKVMRRQRIRMQRIRIKF